MSSSPTEAVTVLSNSAEDKQRRIAAAIALGDLRERSAVRILVEAFGEGDAELAWACSHALISIKSRRHGRKLIAMALGNPSAPVREAAVYCLWILGEVRAEHALISIAENLEAEVVQTRSLATEALGNTVERSHTQRALARRLFDPSPGVRYSALCALSAYCERLPEFLIAALRSKLSDPDRVDPDRVDDERLIASLAREILSRDGIPPP